MISSAQFWGEVQSENIVMCDTMGDLWLIRNGIVHDQTVADHKVSRLKVLSWPNKIGGFAVGPTEMEELQRTINTMQIYHRGAVCNLRRT